MHSDICLYLIMIFHSDHATQTLGDCHISAQGENIVNPVVLQYVFKIPGSCDRNCRRFVIRLL